MSEIKTNKISSLDSSNSDITIEPDGTGDVVVSGATLTANTTDNFPITWQGASGGATGALYGDGSAVGMFNGAAFTTGVWANTSNEVYIRNNGSNTVKVDSNGIVSIPANHGDYAFQIVNDGNNVDRRGIRIQCGSDSGAGTSYLLGFIDGDGNSVGSITFSGSNTSFNTSSDHRLKEAVVDMTGAIDRVKALAPKRFNFIRHPDTTVDGFIAHEAQAVVPESVTGTHNEVDDDGNAVMQGIDQSKLVPLLTGALQEAIAKIETLETENSTQATQIADLITRVTALENA